MKCQHRCPLCGKEQLRFRETWLCPDCNWPQIYAMATGCNWVLAYKIKKRNKNG